ncbi:MAG: LytTR family DNA-binding domain-containing protein [Arcobacteraceae bacterium]|jgi:two-component system LytT family response regulator|nr:LytTR family DNA-binding domain-containing protein [Arcobacteraceae bacterium]
MKILVIDDEQLALDRMKRILGELGYKDVTASLEYSIALEQRFDVVFLDINMPEINGIELGKMVLKNFPLTKIVFQTAYDEFALDAFEVGSVDYILKPIELERVEKTLARVKKMVAKSNEKLLVKLGGNSYILNPSDVCYIKADLAEVYVKSKIASGYMSNNMSDLELSLEPFGFVRVHRSYLVNLNKIKSLSSIENSKFVITFYDIDDELISSKEGAKYLRGYLENITI